MSEIICISPVDGRVVDQRKTLEQGEIERALQRARAAQDEWKQVPLQARIDLALKFLDVLLGMNAEIVPELAWQMGRPVRYNGEARSVEERVRFMAGHAREFLSPLTPPSPIDRIDRYVQRDPLGIV